MTAMTRSASITPSSMSLASSEASLTLCSGTLRTSIGAGIGSSSLNGSQDGADVVTVDGVGDVLEGRDDGAAARPVGEAQGRLDLGAHAAAGELPVRGVLAQLGSGDPAQRALVWRPVADHHGGDVGGDDQGV